MRKAYTNELKADIINRYYNGATPTELSNESNIARSTIYAWIKTNKRKPKWTEKIDMREINGLMQKCQQQQKMIEILQIASCTVTAPLRNRYAVIKELEGKYSINLLCKTMKVAKGSYYNHIFRNKSENTKFEEKKRELAPVIEKIFNDSKQIYGTSKIHAILKDRGYIVGQNTIADIIHENGWFALDTVQKALLYEP